MHDRDAAQGLRSIGGTRRLCSVRPARDHRGMWQVTVFCSGCAEEPDLVVEDLDRVEREACECGYSFVVLSVASFEPVYAQDGELIELSPRKDLLLAA